MNALCVHGAGLLVPGMPGGAGVSSQPIGCQRLWQAQLLHLLSIAAGGQVSRGVPDTTAIKGRGPYEQINPIQGNKAYHML